MDLWPTLTDFSSLASWYQALGPLGVILSATLMVACALTVLPAEASAIANGMVYGAFWGALLTWGSALLGANIAFGLARKLGPRYVAKIAAPEYLDKVDEWTKSHGAWVLLLARCVPVIPFFALNYAAGLSAMRWSTYNLVTAIGILPAIIVLTVVGEQALHMHWSVWIVIAAIFLAVSWLLKQLLFIRANDRANDSLQNQLRSANAVSSFSDANEKPK